MLHDTIRPLAIALTLSLIALPASLFAQGLDIRLDLSKSCKQGDTVLLGYYMEEGRYVHDTAYVDAKKQALFQSDTLAPQGMYFFMLPTGHALDILLDKEQRFELSIDTVNTLETLHLKGSPMLADFFELQRTMQRVQLAYHRALQLDSIASKKKNPEKSKEKKQATEIRDTTTRYITGYVKRLQERNKGNFLATFARSTEQVEIPEPPESIYKEGKNRDSAKFVWQYYYNRQHYLDNFDLTSEGMLRTPVLQPRLHFYLDKMILQIPDTIAHYCNLVLERARPNKRVYSTLAYNLLQRYQTSEVMGMDAVFVNLAKKHFLLPGNPLELKQESYKQLEERIAKMEPTLIGNVAPDFTVETLERGKFQLHAKSKAKMTIVVFWEPSCSHCKVAVPQLDSIAQPYFAKGLRIVGFMTMGDGPEWQKFVQEKKLNKWIHVWDPYRKTKFHDTYDIYSTPVVFIMDEENRIVAKRIDMKSVGSVLKELLADPEATKKEGKKEDK